MGWLVTKVITYRMDQQEKIRKSENIQQEETDGEKGVKVEEWLSGRKLQFPH